jgi:tetratricopeptide (TPR) repeat protein
MRRQMKIKLVLAAIFTLTAMLSYALSYDEYHSFMQKHIEAGYPVEEYEKSLEISNEMINDRFYLNWKQQRIVFLNHANILYASTQYGAAIEYFEKALDVADVLDSENSMRLGLAYTMNNQYEEAVKYLLKAVNDAKFINSYPAAGELYLELGKAYYSIREYYKALNWLDKALEKDEGTILVESILVEQAETYRELRKFKEAENVLIELLKYGENGSRLYVLGEMQENQGKCEEALDSYIKAHKYGFIQDYIDIEGIYNNVALCYYKKEEYDKSIEYYDKAIEERPNYAAAIAGKAKVYKKLKQYPEAFKLFKKAAELEPSKEHEYINEMASITKIQTFGTDNVPDLNNATYEEKQRFAETVTKHTDEKNGVDNTPKTYHDFSRLCNDSLSTSYIYHEKAMLKDNPEGLKKFFESKEFNCTKAIELALDDEELKQAYADRAILYSYFAHSSYPRGKPERDDPFGYRFKAEKDFSKLYELGEALIISIELAKTYMDVIPPEVAAKYKEMLIAEGHGGYFEKPKRSSKSSGDFFWYLIAGLLTMGAFKFGIWLAKLGSKD